LIHSKMPKNEAIQILFHAPVHARQTFETIEFYIGRLEKVLMLVAYHLQNFKPIFSLTFLDILFNTAFMNTISRNSFLKDVQSSRRNIRRLSIIEHMNISIGRKRIGKKYYKVMNS